MATLRIEKVDGSLPDTLQPDTLYFVKSGANVNTYISDSTGASAYPVTPSSGAAVAELHPFLLMGAGNA